MDSHSFLFQALVFLASAVVMVPVAKKLGLGSVLGYLLAGMLIGPAFLGFVGSEGESILHFAEFGVVMMLFIIGLELQPALLWKMRHSIIGLGGLQVIVTTLVVFSAALFAGLAWQPSLAIGLTLSLSSTAIVLQTLQEKSLMKTGAGQSSFAVLLFQDIAVIPMLALFPVLATFPASASGAEETSLITGLPTWAQTLVILGAVATIILAGRFLVRPLFRVIAATRLREIFTASALLLVVGIAVLMTQVGLSPALGTFLAGVVLANSEYRHELESDIEPFKGLLLGLFFIAVGASIDFSLVGDRPLLIAGLVSGIIVLKGTVLFLLGKLFRLRFRDNWLFACALSQVGEFAFVLLSFSLQKGILPPEVTEIMMAVVAMSMALTPLLMLLYDRFIRKDEAQGGEVRDADTIHEFNPVIVAGFGDFGNTVGRFLRAHHIGMTILDNNPERVELLRRTGFKVYYGDASRMELLHAAGAGKAKLIIIAIEPAEKRLEMIETIKKHFPELRMLVRANNRFDAYDQMNAGMLHVYRETLDTALRMGVDVMKLLGYRAYSAQRANRTFRRLEESNLKKLASIKNMDEYLSTESEKIEELERILQQDNTQFDAVLDTGWDEESLIAEANKQETGN
jgi:monovalent cation:proton antiporter-2 (CPA2) family protein